LPHYFSTFQTYVMSEAEMERGRFDFGVALKILQTEAEYRAKQGGRQGLFLYHFETLCRNRLRYDQGLKAMADDVAYDADWADWILHVRKQVGLIDIAEMVYFRSEYYLQERARRGMEPPPNPMPMLFGQKEGRIALANRRRDPLLLFAALQRQLDYPPVPRLTPVDETPELIPQLMRRVERIETRIKLVEEEQRGGIDITRFYGKQNDETDDDNVSP